MESLNIEVVAGMSSTLIFVCSNLPMIAKALMTKNLKSYSLGQIGMANLGNLIHWIYVASLPIGPIWLLHGFNSIVSVMMLLFYLRFELNFSPRLVGN